MWTVSANRKKNSCVLSVTVCLLVSLFSYKFHEDIASQSAVFVPNYIKCSTMRDENYFDILKCLFPQLPLVKTTHSHFTHVRIFRHDCPAFLFLLYHKTTKLLPDINYLNVSIPLIAHMVQLNNGTILS